MKTLPDAPSGDMPPADFRSYGHQLIDWVADYLEHTDDYQVLPSIAPGTIRSQIPKAPPERGESMETILEVCDSADSLVTNPHKWLFTPIDLSVLFCRRP
jgi:hypothetical protein